MSKLQPLLTAVIAFAIISLGSLEPVSYSDKQFDDVPIKNDAATFQCDRITCPKEAVRCEIFKYPDEANSANTVRKNICYGPNGDVLLQDISQNPGIPGQTQQIHEIISKDGFSSSSFIKSESSQTFNGSDTIDGEALEKNINETVEKAIGEGEALRQKIHENVQKQLDELNRNLEERLGGLWGGFN